jgi:hypothetical protein
MLIDFAINDSGPAKMAGPERKQILRELSSLVVML